MNSALRKSYSNLAVNSNLEIIFFIIFNFKQNKQYSNVHLFSLKNVFPWKMTYFLTLGYKPEDEPNQTTTQIIN